MELACETLMTMLDYLGLEAEIRFEVKGSRVGLIVSSEEAGRIIGRKGQSLEAMQLLVNRMMQKRDEDFPRVLIDIDGYSRPVREKGPRGEKGERPERSARPERNERNERNDRNDRNDRGDREGRGRCTPEQEEALEKKALDAAKEVKRWGESVTLPEMNAHERRLIHIALKEDTEIATDSKGDGARKSVVITLAK